MFKWHSQRGRRKQLALPKLQRKYFSFKELLASNNEALLLLSELASRPIDPGILTMSHLQAHCTELSVEVFKIIHHLEIVTQPLHAMKPCSFERLEERINGAQEKIWIAENEKSLEG